MKTSLLTLLLPAAASARFIEANEAKVFPPVDALLEDYSAPSRYLIEVSPGFTEWVTEEEKWELRRRGVQFMDITDNTDLGTLHVATKATTVFPKKVQLQSEIHPMLGDLSKDLMKEHLEKFTSFHTRYYKSDYGRQSSEWLLQTVQDTIEEAGADKYGVRAEHFKHSWGQNSIIATIPGKSNSTVVIGAHQDSINLWLPSVLPAPGADDDGSGTVTILEAFRVLLSSNDIIIGNATNTIEFHWYSAEEGGLLGSQAIFKEYEKQGRNVKAMLQQDMTGYVQGTLDAGKPESVGVITDFVDPNLTDFIKKVIEEYCKIPWVETKCGYACSDHASASKAGYPSAFVIESTFGDSDQKIHSTDDLIKYLSFDHMLQHARMTLSLVYELGFTDFEKLEAGHETMGEL
ncbi:Zn-dependent exopeptidase [Hypoxylon sp. FL1150]|nr:Zn-dependent exopeptidase [Hypoxylon sp. FL1150]